MTTATKISITISESWIDVHAGENHDDAIRVYYRNEGETHEAFTKRIEHQITKVDFVHATVDNIFVS